MIADEVVCVRRTARLYFARCTASKRGRASPPRARRSTSGASASGPSEQDWLRAFSYVDQHWGRKNVWQNAMSLLSGVCKRTLKRRYAARNSGPTVKGPPPVLGHDTEKLLVNYALEMTNIGASIGIDDLISRAKQGAVALHLDADSIGGSDWKARFLARHPELAVRLGQKTGYERYTSATLDNCTRFMDLVELSVSRARPEDIYIVDECGGKPENHNRQVR